MATERDHTPLLPLTPPSATTQTTVVLCDYGEALLGDRRLGTVLSQRTRRSGSGKTSVRMTLDIKAEPLLADLNGVNLGKPAAFAIQQIVQEQTRAITEMASPATIARRERAAKELSGGSAFRRWRGQQVVAGVDVRARYIAARTPNNRPGWGARIGNDSGLLANGWFVTQNPKEGAWTINSPANRFDMKTWTGDAASMQAWIMRFVSLVPALRDPRTIASDRRFREAVLSAPPVIKIARGNLQRLRELVQALGSSVSGVSSTINGATGLAGRLGG